MNYLLDVNALVAWHHPNAQDHAAFHVWHRANSGAGLWSCAITELGFLRVSMQAFRYDARQAAAALAQLKRSLRYAAELPPPQLPAWAKTAASTTDAYLQQIATHHGAQLATFDASIPGAVRI